MHEKGGSFKREKEYKPREGKKVLGGKNDALGGEVLWGVKEEGRTPQEGADGKKRKKRTPNTPNWTPPHPPSKTGSRRTYQNFQKPQTFKDEISGKKKK